MNAKKKKKKLSFPVSRGFFVSNRLLHKQNVALYQKLDEMERSLSQQNMVLERLLIERTQDNTSSEQQAQLQGTTTDDAPSQLNGRKLGTNVLPSAQDTKSTGATSDQL